MKVGCVERREIDVNVNLPSVCVGMHWRDISGRAANLVRS